MVMITFCEVDSYSLTEHIVEVAIWSVPETPDLQSTYHMYVENTRSGIMKRSGMDVNVISDAQTLPVYSVSHHHHHIFFI